MKQPKTIYLEFPLTPFNGQFCGTCWTRVDGEQVDAPEQFRKYIDADQMRGLVEALEFYAQKPNKTGSPWIKIEKTTDLSKTTAVLHTEITEENRFFKSTRWKLSGRGQLDHGERARAALKKWGEG
jgi:hypothetical protein